MSEAEKQPVDVLDNRLAGLERRLKREKAARKQAETLLTEKSRDLFEALSLSKVTQDKLELALWASQESYWEWHAEQDSFLIRSFGLSEKKVYQTERNAFSLMSHIHPDDMSQAQFQWALALYSGCEDIEIAFRLRTRSGYQWIRARGKVLERNQAGAATYIVGTAKDKTQQHKAEQSFQLMASAFASSREPMLVLASDLTITESNQAFLNMAHLEAQVGCKGRRLDQFLDATNYPMERVLESGHERFETEFCDGRGNRIPVDVSIAKFESTEQKSAYLIATMSDISERKENELRLKQLAVHDDLTGLKNRLGLRQFINGLIEKQQPYWLAFVDLDGFKNINDVAGHEKGDACLTHVAQVLEATFPLPALVTRWGGDEFLIAIPEGDEQSVTIAGQMLIRELEKSAVITGRNELTVSASVGLAQYPSHGSDAEQIIQNADAAMYQAKTNGKGRVFVYHEGLAESMKAQVTILSDFRRTVRNRRLEFYIQGKYNVSGRLIGAELLSRWFSPLHGVVSPAVFIPLAEANGLDEDIGYMALEAACEYISMFETEGISIPMSINISANQLLSKDFPKNARCICEEHFVSPSMIEIEITESIFIQDEATALCGLAALKNLGFVIAMDDFGTGFSSLSYLRNFEFDVIKLDQSLVKGIHTSSTAHSLLYGIVKMLNSLRFDIIIEGVDNVAYIPLLEEMGITAYQGFLFEKPLPYDQFIYKHAHGWKLSSGPR